MRELVHVLDADDGAGNSGFDANLERALGNVLGQVTHPLEIAGDSNGADDFPQVDRDRLAAGDRQDRLLLDLALKQVEARVRRYDVMGERCVGGGERIHGVDHHFLGEAAHLGDPPLKQVEVLVVGSDGMLVHHGVASR